MNRRILEVPGSRSVRSMSMRAGQRLQTLLVSSASLVAGLVLALGVSTTKAQEPPALEQCEALRAEGPEAFERLHAEYQSLINRCRSAPLTPEQNEQWQTALDAIGGARLSSRSGLYWYSDWDQALAAADRSGKPILSLRLLGQLTDEQSCANSRFFRTLLYPDPQIASILKDQYILHWKSVRPVPRVTIEFGDGRKLCTTLTGNSIHYVTTSDGFVVDALPGLNGPQWFATWLQQAHALATSIGSQSDEAVRIETLRQVHTFAIDRSTKQWNERITQLTGQSPVRVNKGGKENPNAVKSSRLAVTKMVMVEVPVLADVYRDLEQLEAGTNNQHWKQLGQMFVDHCQLSQPAKSIIHEQTYAGLANSSETELSQLIEQRIEKLQETLAWDTAQNEYLLRSKVRKILIDGNHPSSVDRLNAQVYDTVFMTPNGDPWLGLLPADRYSALENDGVRLDDRG